MYGISIKILYLFKINPYRFLVKLLLKAYLHTGETDKVSTDTESSTRPGLSTHTRYIGIQNREGRGSSKGDEAHAYRISRAIIERGLDIDILISVQPYDVKQEVFSLLKKAGLVSVILAVDNFSQPVLDRYCKMTTVSQNLRSIKVLTKLDIDAYLGIIMFDPWTTLQELEDNFKVLSASEIPFLRPWQFISKLDAYYGGTLTDRMLEEGILQREGFTAQYDILGTQVQSAYFGLHKLIQISQPVLSAMDRYRWGSVGQDRFDDLVKQHNQKELNRLFEKYNREISGLALEVVRRQIDAVEPLSQSELVTSEIKQQLRGLNYRTNQQIEELCTDAMLAEEDAFE